MNTRERYRLVAGRLRHVSGWKKEPVDHRDVRLSVPGPVLPASMNLMPRFPAVNDQGALGSCVANGVSEALEYLEPADVQPRTMFSRLYLYFWGRQAEGVPAAEDSGMYIRDAVKVVADRGICLESLWPYSDDKTTYAIQPPAACDTDAAKHKAVFYYRCADATGRASVLAMKASIAQGFPVVFGFNVPANFMSDQCASTGILHYPQPGESYDGGHCIVGGGYDDNFVIDGVAGAFLCRNSWSAGWGLGGNFWMPYRFITYAIADDPWSLRRATV